MISTTLSNRCDAKKKTGIGEAIADIATAKSGFLSRDDDGSVSSFGNHTPLKVSWTHQP